MFHRLCHVLLTYATRPMMWVLSGAYGLALIALTAIGPLLWFKWRGWF